MCCSNEAGKAIVLLLIVFGTLILPNLVRAIKFGHVGNCSYVPAQSTVPTHRDFSNGTLIVRCDYLVEQQEASIMYVIILHEKPLFF